MFSIDEVTDHSFPLASRQFSCLLALPLYRLLGADFLQSRVFRVAESIVEDRLPARTAVIALQPAHLPPSPPFPSYPPRSGTPRWIGLKSGG